MDIYTTYTANVTEATFGLAGKCYDMIKINENLK